MAHNPLKKLASSKRKDISPLGLIASEGKAPVVEPAIKETAKKVKHVSIPCFQIEGVDMVIFCPIGCWSFEGRHQFFQSVTQFGFAKFYNPSKVENDIHTASEMGEYMRIARLLAYDLFPKHLEHAREFGWFKLHNFRFIPGVLTNKLGTLEFVPMFTPEENAAFLQGL